MLRKANNSHLKQNKPEFANFFFDFNQKPPFNFVYSMCALWLNNRYMNQFDKNDFVKSNILNEVLLIFLLFLLLLLSLSLMLLFCIENYLFSLTISTITAIRNRYLYHHYHIIVIIVVDASLFTIVILCISYLNS